MTFGEAAGMERLQDTHNSTPHSAAPQLPEAGPLASSSGSQHVESGYSSMANSQIYPQSPQEAQARLQLQSIAQASQARVVNSLPSIIDSPPSPLTKPPGAHDHGVGGVGGGGGGGLGPAGTGGGEGRPKPPISHFAPQSSPAAHPAHTPNPPGQQEYTAAGSRAPAISPAAEDVPTTPTLPPIAGGAPSAPGSGGPALMTAPPSISPPKSTATLAGVKRTASGAVKTSALSVPNSPLEMLSPSALGVPASPRVDPSRIQELSAQLRTRLKYARIKVDNNWTTKSLDQVESIYHSNHNSPARGGTSSTSTIVGRDHGDERDDGLSAFGPPIHHARRHGHSRTISEPMNHFHHHHHGSDGAKTYENFWKERAPFTKMLEKLTSSGHPIGPGGGGGGGNGGYYQQHPYQHQYHHHHQQYGGPQQPGPGNHQYPPPPQSRSPGRGGGGQGEFRYQQEHHQQQQQHQPPPSPGSRAPRPPPPPLTPSHSNLSNYSAKYNDSPQPPSTPQQAGHHNNNHQSHHHHTHHPSLSRGVSNKSAEEEAVESLMFLMSSPGTAATTTATPRREPRQFQGYQVNLGGRRGSLLRENSDGWGAPAAASGNGGEVDLDVTDAEELGGGEEDEDDDQLPPLVSRRGGGGGQGFGGAAAVGVRSDVVEFRRRSDGAIRYTPGDGGRIRGKVAAAAAVVATTTTTAAMHGKSGGGGATATGTTSSGKRKLGVGVSGGGGGGGSGGGGGGNQSNGSSRRLAPAFNPT